MIDAILALLEPRLLSTAAALSSGRADLADELAQEGRIGAWRALERYEAGSQVRPETFAYCAARFAMLDTLRREGRRVPLAEIGEAAGAGATVEDLVGGAEEWRARCAALDERTAIVLRASAAGWSALEIAQILGLSEDRARQIRLDGLRAVVLHRSERASTAVQSTSRRSSTSSTRSGSSSASSSPTRACSASTSR